MEKTISIPHDKVLYEQYLKNVKDFKNDCKVLRNMHLKTFANMFSLDNNDNLITDNDCNNKNFLEKIKKIKEKAFLLLEKISSDEQYFMQHRLQPDRWFSKSLKETLNEVNELFKNSSGSSQEDKQLTLAPNNGSINDSSGIINSLATLGNTLNAIPERPFYTRMSTKNEWIQYFQPNDSYSSLRDCYNDYYSNGNFNGFLYLSNQILFGWDTTLIFFKIDTEKKISFWDSIFNNKSELMQGISDLNIKRNNYITQDVYYRTATKLYESNYAAFHLPTEDQLSIYENDCKSIKFTLGHVPLVIFHRPSNVNDQKKLEMDLMTKFPEHRERMYLRENLSIEEWNEKITNGITELSVIGAHGNPNSLKINGLCRSLYLAGLKAAQRDSSNLDLATEPDQ